MDPQIESEVEKIVEEGEDVRGRIRTLVEEAARGARDTSRSLVDLSKTVLTSAARAAERATPEDPASPLRQVVDGLADGFQRTAQAAQLAVEEAAGEGRTFAEEDLRDLKDDLEDLSRLFVQTVDEVVSTGGQRLRNEIESLRSHAQRTYSGIAPALIDAAAAAAKHPVRFAKESGSAATAAGKETAGMLFRAMGDLFQRAGDRLGRRDED